MRETWEFLSYVVTVVGFLFVIAVFIYEEGKFEHHVCTVNRLKQEGQFHQRDSSPLRPREGAPAN